MAGDGLKTKPLQSADVAGEEAVQESQQKLEECVQKLEEASKQEVAANTALREARGSQWVARWARKQARKDAKAKASASAEKYLKEADESQKPSVVAQAARELYAKEFIAYFVRERQDADAARAAQDAATSAVEETTKAREAAEQEERVARDAAESVKAAFVAAERHRDSLPPAYFELPEHIRDLLESAIFFAHARQQCSSALEAPPWLPGGACLQHG